MALGHLGVGQTVTDALTEKSAEASACRTFYDTAKDVTLRDYQWPFATRFKALDLIEADPTTEWGFAYRFPNDCLELRRIFSGVRNDTVQSRVKYILGQDNAGLIIYTDQYQAEAEYTAKSDNPVLYPPDVAMALSLRLAAYMAPMVTRGDPFKLGARAEQLYKMEIMQAIATAKNEENRDELPDSEFIKARD